MTKGKSSIWDAVKGALVETAPDAPGVVHGWLGAGTSIGAGAVAVLGQGGTAGGTASSFVGVSSADPAAVAKIEARLKAATPAIYAAYTEQADALKDVIADETTRLRAAMKTSHATPEQISGAIDALLTVANAVLTEFNQSFEAKRTAATSAATSQIEMDKKQVEVLEAQLKDLQEHAAGLRAKVASEEEQMQIDAARLEGIRQGFQAAHAQVVARLNADKQRITTQTRIG
jgi:hypothetical protein